jgi:hypothetical protein
MPQRECVGHFSVLSIPCTHQPRNIRKDTDTGRVRIEPQGDLPATELGPGYFRIAAFETDPLAT